MIRTAAPRSTVIHVIDTRPGKDPRRTVCGLAIGETWAGEMSEAPTGDVTCKPVSLRKPVADVREADRKWWDNAERVAASVGADVAAVRELRTDRDRSMAAHPAGKARPLIKGADGSVQLRNARRRRTAQFTVHALTGARSSRVPLTGYILTTGETWADARDGLTGEGIRRVYSLPSL